MPVGRALGGLCSDGLHRNGAEVASCCNTPIHRWGALAIRPGGPAADTMAFMHRVSGWLGRLSVGRKLMLIYLLDLTAVIYVSSILIHEKYLAIDFTRKEVVGTTYAAVVRDGLMGQFLDASQQPPLVADVLTRLEAVRAAVVGLLGQYRNPHFNSKHKFMLTRESDGGPMLVEQLSQGYQSMLALAMDFARRLAIANPHLEYNDEDYAVKVIRQSMDQLAALGVVSSDPFQTSLRMSAPAIMLVDEIDLHLHPSWQQRVLQDLMRTFPLTQFIVTTHSPQVLSTVRRENIRILDGSHADMPFASTYGQPSGDVMHSVMLVDPQPPIEEKQRIDRLTALVDQGH